MDIINLLDQKPTNDFDTIRISIASPEQIKSWSFGEILKPETINYRTFKSEKDGLFCCRIFGPTKNYECQCGKYKRMKYAGVICEKCGVEVTVSRVRRERMAHINLAAPVAHIWFLKSMPSKISTILDMMVRDVEKILYFESFIVVDQGISSLPKYMLLTEEELVKVQEQYGEDSFTAMIGAEAIKYLLENLDLENLKNELQQEVSSDISDVRRKKVAKRLKLVEEFLESKNKPEWMVLTVLPVIPPDIRPLVMLDGGRFAASDLNELYRRVINRNNRLKRLLELNAPEIIIRNEKRMLQESVDALFDNGKRGKSLKASNKRPYKSLSDMLKGKRGRFRLNLLGKRVDYSGRSVIVSGPKLKLYQCGLPKQMALELFKPFIYSKLISSGMATTVKAAKKMVELEKNQVWGILESVIQGHPVLLNRAPTLHRLGIQAFEPVLIDGKAIQLHPLVCAAFNADFDGDQMAVHIPLSIEAQVEARVLMMSTNNILSPSNGRPIIVPDKDIVLGIYYLTMLEEGLEGQGSIFGSMDQINKALDFKYIKLHTKIKYRIYSIDETGEKVGSLEETTPGRLILRSVAPEGLDFKYINKTLSKKDITSLVDTVYKKFGQKQTILFADNLMQLGFKYATISGISFGMDDMVVPPNKQKHISSTLAEIKEFEHQYMDGLITHKEKYNKAVDAWSHCTDKVANEMMKEISKHQTRKYTDGTEVNYLNSIYIMAVSGARGSTAQMKQLAGMRGLMAKSSGEIIETPIISNFKEGLTVLEYFNSTHGARKGLTDVALKTANSGYLTRRLVDVSQDCIVTDYDCETHDGIMMSALVEGDQIMVSLEDKIAGRCSSVDILHPQTNQILAKAGDLITDPIVEKIIAAKIDSVKVRSVLTCKIYDGLCSKCYGINLSNGRLVSVGEAVGVIAAQSIGEPGTQLTMRTFHIGGAATKMKESSFIESNYDGKIKILNGNIVTNSDKNQIVINRICEVLIVDDLDKEKARYKMPYGCKIFVKNNQAISRGKRISEWDLYTIPIITEKSGNIVFHDMIEGVSMRDIVDESTGISAKVIIEAKRYEKKGEMRPCMHIVDDKGDLLILSNGLEARYYLPINAVLNIEDGSRVTSGDILARIPRESVKTKDITGGLPRVVELFEARKHKDHGIIAEEDGRIEFGKDYKNKKRVILHPSDGRFPIEYIIPKNKHIMVSDGDLVRKGDTIIEGILLLQDTLKVMGIESLARFMTEEVQSVYRLQAVKIDDKHIEIIIRQMLQKVEITEPGDTVLLAGEKINKYDLFEINEKAEKRSLKPAEFQPIIQGITKSSLQTRSFLSGASFQETTKILTDAAVCGKVDPLKGLKENVIVGRLIKAGTGLYVKKSKKIAMKIDEENEEKQSHKN